MKIIRFACITLILAMTALAGAACAASVNFWFAAQGDPAGTPITSINVVPGGTFDLSVWYQTDDSWAHNAVELLVGFDRATSVGTGATPLDNKIVEVGISGIAFPIVLANNLGGGYSSTPGDRPYGAHLALGADLGTTITASSPVRIADISLRNQAIPGGSYYDMKIWDAGSGTYSTSYAVMSSTLRRDPTAATLRVNSGTAPEYTVKQWKELGDNSLGKLVGLEVTADVGDSFFVESADRTSGIRVSKLGSETYTPGMRVTVTGTINTNGNQERYIASTAITTTAGTPTIRSIGLVGKSLGGGDWHYVPATGAGQAGVSGGSGVNNVGLLVRAWGKPVLTGSPNSFKIDDGSSVSVTVQLPAGQNHGWNAGNLPAYVMVTGASGLKAAGTITSAIYISDFATDVRSL